MPDPPYSCVQGEYYVKINSVVRVSNYFADILGTDSCMDISNSTKIIARSLWLNCTKTKRYIGRVEMLSDDARINVESQTHVNQATKPNVTQ